MGQPPRKHSGFSETDWKMLPAPPDFVKNIVLAILKAACPQIPYKVHFIFKVLRAHSTLSKLITLRTSHCSCEHMPSPTLPRTAPPRMRSWSAMHAKIAPRPKLHYPLKDICFPNTIPIISFIIHCKHDYVFNLLSLYSKIK